jgi:hypothetical protein
MLGAAAGLAAGGFAPSGLRLSTQTKRDLWRRASGPHLRGAVFVQRRIYRELDGPRFLGPGQFGPPTSDDALARLADAGGNLASWSGPGLFAEGGAFNLDASVEDHIGTWLDRCRSRGLFTTLCFRSGPGRSAFAFHPGESWYPSRLYDVSVWRDDEKQAAWAEMVAQSFARFGDHPALAGIVAVEEPNGADLGHRDAWPRFAQRIVRQVKAQALDRHTPLLLSPDRWARAEAASTLRDAVGEEVALVLHDYQPWDYTHQSQAESVRFDPRCIDDRDSEELSGDWAMLEFGAVRHAPGLVQYLDHRIERWERLGANWAAFRWDSGWQPYESQEGLMAVNRHRAALARLQAAFAHNLRRPN